MINLKSTTNWVDILDKLAKIIDQCPELASRAFSSRCRKYKLPDMGGEARRYSIVVCERFCFPGI